MASELKTGRLQVVVEPSVLQRIDDYRFSNRIGSRSEAVRLLMLQSLTHNEKADAGATASAS
jgi:metal-responsive CopG/Arc/MetJ family transcriptional regulator